jgi:opacity protein-like surface antigen
MVYFCARFDGRFGAERPWMQQVEMQTDQPHGIPRVLVGATAAMLLAFTSMGAQTALADDYYASPDRFSGFYAGVLGQYTHARAKFRWGDTELFNRPSDNWGVGGVFGYGWKSGALYFAPEAYVDYANVSNSLVDTVITGSGTVTKVSLDRRVGAGINLIGGVTAFDDQVLFYGLLGGGATNFAGNITVDATTLSADIWYPVFSAGGGIEWAWTDNLALRLEGKHTFYYDVSDRIFPSNTDQAYNFDTTSVSVGITWRPWN